MINRLSWIEYRLAVECSRECRWTKTAMKRTEREPYHSWTSSQAAKANDRITCRLCRRQSDIECKRTSTATALLQLTSSPARRDSFWQLQRAPCRDTSRLALRGIDNPVSSFLCFFCCCFCSEDVLFSDSQAAVFGSKRFNKEYVVSRFVSSEKRKKL